MAMEVKCSHCGKAYRVAEQMAGKKAKCKGCGQTFVIQAPPAAGGGDDLLAGLTSAASSEQRSVAVPPRVEDVAPRPAEVCPACGAPLAPSAVLCVSCGYNRQTGGRAQTQVVREAPPQPARTPSYQSKAPATYDDESISGLEIVLCIFCSTIGCILGIVYLIQGKRKGLTMIMIVIAVSVIAFIIGFVAEMAKQGGTP